MQSCTAMHACAAAMLQCAASPVVRPTASGRLRLRSVRLQVKVSSGARCIGSASNSNGSGKQQQRQPPPQQQQQDTADDEQHIFMVGASVYDASHHGECRGYGVINEAAEPGPDGVPRWRVRFERGTRSTVISETYLCLSRIHHHSRVGPRHPNQRIVVLVGPQNGKAGVTVAKCGDKWTCKLDGAERHESFPSERLHALEQPNWGRVFEHFEPLLVDEAVPLEDIGSWVQSYCSKPDKPCRLIRRHPAAELWVSMLSKKRSVSSLTDCEVEGLKYLLKEPGDVASMRECLQQKADGNWTISYKCAQAAKCGCPFELLLKHASGSDNVEVWEMEMHQYHDPDSAAERAQLKMDPEVQALVELLLECGVKPYRVWWQVTAQQVIAGALGSGSLAAASDARYSITLAQVYAVRKRMQRAAGYGLTSDAVAVAAQMAELSKLGIVKFYQPMRERCDGTGTASDGQALVTIQCEDGLHQPLMIILQTPFQQRMLAEFGGRLIFMDATGGTNKYGYSTQAAMVVDEHGRGVPVGFMICSSDPTEVVEKFLRALQQGARDGGKPDFKYGYVMVDKSRQEMAAVRQLVLTGDATDFLLCYFHYLQEWERFVRSSDSGVNGKPMQHRILLELAELAHMRDQILFEEKLQAFYTAHAAHPKVVANMKQNWAGSAKHWAWWGRLSILDLAANTNNVLERGWGLFKYTHLNRNTQSTIQQLVDVLVGVWVPAAMKQRELQLAGRTCSDQRRRVQRVDEMVAEMVSSGAVSTVDVAGMPGLTSMKKLGGRGEVKACLGDLSCTCRFSAEAVCVHLRAASKAVGFTPNLRAAAAAYLLERGGIRVDAATGVCSCTTLADLLKPVIFRPQDGSCTCHDHALHGTCCHLLAAAQLQEFAGMELLTGLLPMEGEGEQRIDISRHRTFQQPSSEPLGDDWGKAEMEALLAVPRSTAGAIRQAVSNADPAMAQLRSDAAYVQRAYAALPDGEQREALLKQSADLRRGAEAAVGMAQLPLTTARAGKVVRRQQGRPEGQRKVTALHPGRKSNRKRSLVQQDTSDHGDEFKPQAKKGRRSEKVRGVTIKNNIHGTTQRCGEHRRYKRQRQATGGSRAS